MTFKVTATSQNLKKIIFLPRLMKFCILVAYKSLIKNLNFGVNRCISGHVILQNKHEIYKIGHISAIFKDRDFWFGPKNSIKSCVEHCTALGVIKCISGHVTAQ